MKIIWTQEALERLTGIGDYISKDSPERAVGFVDQLIQHVELLADTPRAGRIVPEISHPDIRELVFKKYRIVYRVKGEFVEILTVFEGHMLLRIDKPVL